ncbi:hypothetical protein JBO50_22170 [Enterobacter asburiae]|uniref:hypothetical protein n=1 Tax=Enterobacter asburiae TaxID=61645 RepID=UPI00192ADC74|nr:hypothetical protein [Enterobacter asburiae]MBL5972123.1 hypothetical protein [Enterobacter asburiae]
MNSKKRRSSIKKSIFGLAFLSVSMSSGAAGFDCLKSSTPVEHMICENTSLSNLDSALSNLYESKKDNRLKEIQRDWIKRKRNNAKSVDELNMLYAEQILFISKYSLQNKEFESETNTKRENNSKKNGPQLSDFSKEFITVDGMQYSTRYRDMNKSNYVLSCTEAILVDQMNIWKNDSIKKNKSQEFSRLRGNVYNGLWNATADKIESGINTRQVRNICDLMIAGNR